MKGIVSTVTRNTLNFEYCLYEIFLENFGNSYNRINQFDFDHSARESVEKIIQSILRLAGENNVRKFIKRLDGEAEELTYVFIRYKFIISYETNPHSQADSIIILHYENEYEKFRNGDEESKSEKFIQDIIDKFQTIKKSFISHKKKINIICYNDGFYLHELEMKPQQESSFSFEDCYNDDFIPVHNKIVEKLSKNNEKGIVLLHGEFGSGKTSYLRKLISTLDKKIIYMSPELSEKISSPNFITFLMDNPNSILFIEDAETVLKSRESGGNDSVSNLLNVSDGILSDALRLQIVCTFNCEKKEIDSALLRPGRLIAEYKFGKLSEQKTKNLTNKLFGDSVSPTKKQMTIAEIFNMEEYIPSTQDHITKNKIGFV